MFVCPRSAIVRTSDNDQANKPQLHLLINHSTSNKIIMIMQAEGRVVTPEV